VSLSERLQAAMTAAIRERDELRRETLRMAVAAAHLAQKEARRPLTDEEVVSVVARQVKSRRESVEAYERAGRNDLADKERAEIEVLTEFLPQQLSEDELRDMVQAAIEESGASSARDLGRVMGIVAPRTKGRADGKVVSGLVAQELARRDIDSHGGAHETEGKGRGGQESA
jgi:uncharacterized protein YqeY